MLRHEAWRGEGDHGLAPTQAQILVVVASATEPVGLSAVAEQLAITAGTASAAVSSLVEKRLLVKRRSKQDGRAITLALTAKGRRTAAAAGEWPETVLAATAALPDREQTGLLRGLVGLIHELQARGSVPTSRMCVECRFFRPNEYPGKTKAHHCTFLDAPIADADLRVDCPEMEPVAEAIRPRLWSVFVEGKRLDA